jgi:hypothetical protein
VRANRAFRLIVHREGHSPAFLAEPDRLDRIEVVSVEDNEVVLLWDLPPREAGHLVRELKADLAGLSAAEFRDRWEGADSETEPPGTGP